MGRLSLPVGILLTLLIALCSPIHGSNPTYRDCKPLIDATIYDLAAKAIHAGEQPDEPRTDQPCPAAASQTPVEESSQVVTPPAEEAPPRPPPPQAKAPEYVPPPPPPTPREPKSQPVYQETDRVTVTPKQKIGIFDSFINSVFGLKGEYVRESKWAVPWNTHPEFKKKKVEKTSTETTKVDSTPGFIRSSINELVYKIFGNKPASGEREAKWAEPWQTHKEHIRVKVRKEEPTEHAKVDSTPGFIRSSINELVYKIFGNKPASEEREAKWAEPWQTHKEHIRVKVKKEEPTEHAKVDSTPGYIRSSINELVYKIFGNKPASEEREAKWAEPWQTHKEHLRVKVKKEEPTEHAKVDSTPGFIRSSINELVYKIFGNKPTSEERDAKWAEPWQTHKEHLRVKVKKEEPTEHAKVDSTPGFIRSSINELVYKIFGNKPSSEEREHKWAQPWQTHKEHVKAPKLAPVPAVPPPVVHTPPTPQHAHVTPSQPVTVTKESVSPAPHVPPSSYPSPAAPVKAEEILPKTTTPPPQETFPSATQDKKPTSPPVERVVDAPKAPVKQVLEEVAAHQAEVQREAAFEENDQIVVVPSAFRSRDHIDSILGLDEASIHASARTGPIAEATLRDLKKVYETAIKPLEATFKYQDISNRHLSDAELFGTPLMLMLGPYSTGKSTFVNYLLGVEFTKRALKTGTPPSHGVFRIIQYGEHDRDLDGTDLTGHWSFGSLQKFGQNFVDQVRGKALNIPLLKKVTFVEAPGILEMRRPGERLYPFNDAVQWFIDRADLILVMFDYTKLDAGYEMEAILDQLKGREAQTRILLNKADQVPPEELMKVQGSLFWNLSPILGVAAPPNVYAGSFTSLPYRPSSPVKLFQVQEEALLRDVAMAINARVDNRIAITRRHAVRVSNHAQMVDTYLKVFYTNKGFLTSKHKLAEEIIENPHAYNIYEGMSLLTNISRYDLPDAEVYRDFFRIHNLYDFRTLRETCTFIGGCPLEKIDAAINKQLPELMERHRRLVGAASPETRLPDPSLRSSRMGAGTAHVHSTKL